MISRNRFVSVVATSLGFLSGTCIAAPEEIQVYMDDVTRPGYFGTDIHNNYVMSGSSTPDYPGAQPPNHVYRLTPEFYYGLADTIELGLYLLTTTAAGNSPNYDGEKLRVKYIAPHGESQGSFSGVNFEIGKTSQRVSQVPWNAELKGIYGYRAGPWTFAVNPNFDWTMSGWASGSVSLNIDSKVAYQTGSDYQVGFETYNALGPLRDLGHLSQLSQTLFAVIDTKLGNFDLNAGIGHGLTDASDRWLAKLIVGIHY